MEIKAGDIAQVRLAADAVRNSAAVVSVEGTDIVLAATPGIGPVREGQIVIVSGTGGDNYCKVVDGNDGRLRLRRMWSERREYFRVDDVFPVDMAKVDNEPGFLKAKVFHSYDPGSCESGDTPDPGSVSPLLWKMLCDINAKMGLILKKLHMDEEGFGKGGDRAVNISATGIRFTSREDVREGETVELKLLLPTSPPTGIITYGRVVRVSDAGEGEKEVAVHFAEMGEEVRDEIIHYALSRQRQIMGKKKQRESGG